LSDGHGERCFFPERADEFRAAAQLPETWEHMREEMAERRARAMEIDDESTPEE
jgi:hypothetical protein